MYDKRAAVDAASLDLVKLSNPAGRGLPRRLLLGGLHRPGLYQRHQQAAAGASATSSPPAAPPSTTRWWPPPTTYPRTPSTPSRCCWSSPTAKTMRPAPRWSRPSAASRTSTGRSIYCIGLLFGDDTTKTEARHARRVLETLSEQTGGAAYFPKSVKDVDAITKEVANDIRTQYTIAYHSTKPPELGGYRVVHVEAKDKGYGKLSVRTRSGYYPRVTPAASTMRRGSRHAVDAFLALLQLYPEVAPARHLPRRSAPTFQRQTDRTEKPFKRRYCSRIKSVNPQRFTAGSSNCNPSATVGDGFPQEQSNPRNLNRIGPLVTRLIRSRVRSRRSLRWSGSSLSIGAAVSVRLAAGTPSALAVTVTLPDLRWLAAGRARCRSRACAGSPGTGRGPSCCRCRRR